MSTISVAMAVYNGERFLKDQLDSIISQLEESDELIISYDTSQDDSLQILDEYSKKYSQLKVVIDPGKGVFSNFENAIFNASGDYIFISDQDDIWIEGKREAVLKDFKETNADMIIHNGIHIDADGNIISEDFFKIYNIKKNIITNFIKPRYSGCCMAFRKEMKQALLPIPRTVGAYDHWIGMVGELFYTVYFEKEVFLKHRLHGNNVTVSRRKLKTILAARWNLAKELNRLRRRIRNK